MIVCGGELGVREYGSVNSPGYPGNYAHNRDCFWYFVRYFFFSYRVLIND